MNANNISDFDSNNACPFCQGMSQKVAVDQYPVEDRILFDDGEWYCIPTLGHFIPGHLLLMPRMHISSLSEVPAGMLPGMSTHIEHISTAISALYGEDILQFEHGTPTGRDERICGIAHAHLHLLPYSTSLRKYLYTSETPIEIAGIHEIKETLPQNTEEYLYVKDNSGSYLYRSSRFGSQFLRKILANLVGIPNEWNWTEHPKAKEMMDTLDLYRSNFDTTKTGLTVFESNKKSVQLQE